MEKDAAGCRALNHNYYCRRHYLNSNDYDDSSSGRDYPDERSDDSSSGRDYPDERSSPEEHTVPAHGQHYYTKDGVIWKEKEPYQRGGRHDDD